MSDSFGLPGLEQKDFEQVVRSGMMTYFGTRKLSEANFAEIVQQVSLEFGLYLKERFPSDGPSELFRFRGRDEHKLNIQVVRAIAQRVSDRFRNRRKANGKRLPADISLSSLPTVGGEDWTFRRMELAFDLKSALGALSELEKAVFLRVALNLESSRPDSLDTVATELGLTPYRIKVTYEKARKKLALTLKGYEHQGRQNR